MKLPSGSNMLLVAALLLNTNNVIAACSPYAGNATFNEFYKDATNQSETGNDFVELKIIDNSILNATYEQWTVDICEVDGNGNNNDDDGCLSDTNGGSRVSVSTFGDTVAEYLVLKGGVGIYFNLKTGFDAILKDENGLVVDYVSIGSTALEDASCLGSDLPYDYDGGAPGNQDKFVYRTPDGTGDWNFETSAAALPTENASNDGPSATLAYYVISFSGTAVNCEPYTISISAIDGDGDAFLIPAGTILTASTDLSNDGWTNPTGSGATYAVPADTLSVDFQLRKLTAATLEIDVDDDSGGTDDDGSRDDDEVVFSAAGFIFYIDGVAESPSNSIGEQISGKSSAVEPDSKALTIRAVVSDPSDPAICDALITNTATVRFAYSCDNPSSCATTNNAATINSTDVDADTVGFTDVSLSFDSGGYASFTLSYIDAGSIQLLVEADVPVADTGGGTTLVSGISSAFLVKPAGLCVRALEANSDCPGIDYDSCSIFKTVSEDFTLEISGRTWASIGETDSDFCEAGHTITKNFLLDDIVLSTTLVAPTPGATAILSSGGGALTSTSIIAIAGVNEGFVAETVSVNEVGVFTFTAEPQMAYLGATIAPSTSANIGRFVPHHFVVKNAVIDPAVGTFTYMDQPFDIRYIIRAVDQDDITTTNYRLGGVGENFIKLDVTTQLSYGAVESPTGTPQYLSDRLSTDSGSVDWFDGVATIEKTLTLDRDSSLDGPFDDVAIGVLLTDSDAVTLTDLDLETETLGVVVDQKQLDGIVAAFRYGRVYIPPVFGPEIAMGEITDTDVPFVIQYWDSATSLFTLSSDDSISESTVWVWKDNVNCHEPETSDDTLVCSDTNIPIPPEDHPAAALNGEGSLAIKRPGVVGVLNMEVEVEAWFQYEWAIDWDEDSIIVDDIHPSFRVNFGNYRGNDRIIYWREIHN